MFFSYILTKKVRVKVSHNQTMHYKEPPHVATANTYILQNRLSHFFFQDKDNRSSLATTYTTIHYKKEKQKQNSLLIAQSSCLLNPSMYLVTSLSHCLPICCNAPSFQFLARFFALKTSRASASEVQLSAPASVLFFDTVAVLSRAGSLESIVGTIDWSLTKASSPPSSQLTPATSSSPRQNTVEQRIFTGCYSYSCGKESCGKSRRIRIEMHKVDLIIGVGFQSPRHCHS